MILTNKRPEGAAFSFAATYFMLYAAHNIFNNYFSVYLRSLDFNQLQIGVVQSVGPALALLSLPFWGLKADRANSKNMVFFIVLLVPSLVAPVFKISPTFIFALLITAVVFFFQTAIIPMADTITLEYAGANGLRFGRLRLCGTIGFCIMSFCSGFIIEKIGVSNMFWLYLTIGVIAAGISLFLPKVVGHQSKGNKVSFFELLRNNELIVLLVFFFIFQVTYGVYYTYFPIQLTDIGAGTSLVGINFFVSSGVEIPFLFFGERIVRHFGIKPLICFTIFVTAIRWLLLGNLTTVHGLILSNLLHGVTFMVFSFCMSLYLCRVKPQLRASAQMLSAMISASIGRILGNLLGGYFADLFGISKVFVFCSGILFLTAICCVIWIKLTPAIDLSCENE